MTIGMSGCSITEFASFVAPAGARAADAAHSLAGAVLVLDEREAHVVVAMLAEADTGRDRDLGLLQEELRELERAHGLEGVGDLGPHEHRRLGLRHVPAEAIEAVAQDVAALAVGLTDLVHVVLRAVERVRG